MPKDMISYDVMRMGIYHHKLLDVIYPWKKRIGGWFALAKC